MFTLIAAALTVAMLLAIWFDTNAFCEYTCLLGLSRFFHVAEYQQFQGSCDAASFLSYPKFLYEFYPSFVTRLLKCSVCTSVWFGLLVSLVIPPLVNCLAISFAGLNFYLLFTKLVKSNA